MAINPNGSFWTVLGNAFDVGSQYLGNVQAQKAMDYERLMEQQNRERGFKFQYDMVTRQMNKEKEMLDYRTELEDYKRNQQRTEKAKAFGLPETASDFEIQRYETEELPRIQSARQLGLPDTASLADISAKKRANELEDLEKKLQIQKKYEKTSTARTSDPTQFEVNTGVAAATDGKALPLNTAQEMARGTKAALNTEFSDKLSSRFGEMLMSMDKDDFAKFAESIGLDESASVPAVLKQMTPQGGALIDAFPAGKEIDAGFLGLGAKDFTVPPALNATADSLQAVRRSDPLSMIEHPDIVGQPGLGSQYGIPPLRDEFFAGLESVDYLADEDFKEEIIADLLDISDGQAEVGTREEAEMALSDPDNRTAILNSALNDPVFMERVANRKRQREIAAQRVKK